MTRDIFLGGVFLSLSAIAFFMGGIGYRYMVVQDLGIIVGMILVIIAWMINRYRMQLPAYFWVYMAVGVLVGWDVMTRSDPFTSPQLFSMVVSGGMFWVAFYLVGQSALKIAIQKYFWSILLGLGWLFFGLFVVNMGGALDKYELYFGMIQPLTAEHHHLGVYWALLLIPLVVQIFKTRIYTWQVMLPTALGVYLMIISQARSAFLGLMVGLIVFYRKEILARSKQGSLVRVALVVLILVIVGITTYKPIRLFHFYTPAALNLLREPLGSGIGQFEKVSSYYAYLYESGDFVTSSAHNLLFEMTTGLGWLGLMFGIWVYLSISVCMKKKDVGQNKYLAIYIAMLAIFMVDPAYGIPTMYWLWMSSLGLAQSNLESNKLVDLQT